MFEVLHYLCETYHRPDALPEPAALTRTLSDLGFPDSEITDALIWLSDLTETAGSYFSAGIAPEALSNLHRIFAQREYAMLGLDAIRFLQSLESTGCLDPIQREIVIERALAANESPMSLDTLRLIAQIVLWCQGEDGELLESLHPDSLLAGNRLLH